MAHLDRRCIERVIHAVPFEHARFGVAGKGLAMTDQRRICPFGLTEEEVSSLRTLAVYADVLKSVAKAHTALILFTHVIKWLSAIAGGLVLLKGLDIW